MSVIKPIHVSNSTSPNRSFPDALRSVIVSECAEACVLSDTGERGEDSQTGEV